MILLPYSILSLVHTSKFSLANFNLTSFICQYTRWKMTSFSMTSQEKTCQEKLVISRKLPVCTTCQGKYDKWLRNLLPRFFVFTGFCSSQTTEVISHFSGLCGRRSPALITSPRSQISVVLSTNHPHYL